MAVFARRFAKTLGANLLAFGMLASGLYIAHSTAMMDFRPHGLMEGKPNATHSAEWTIAKHDCWTGSAPADVKFPGHVVVIDSHGDVQYSARLVGPALDSLFKGKHVPFQVAGFCR